MPPIASVMSASTSPHKNNVRSGAGKIWSLYASRQFVLFLLSGGAAFALHWLSRIALSLVMPFSIAVVVAYGIGMSSAYALFKTVVFRRSANSPRREMLVFLAVQLAWLPVVWVLSVGLGEHVFPSVFPEQIAHAIAHAIAIATPALVNFLVHKFITFRQRP